MLRHSIYSVRDKKKVDAEVIDIREIESAKGVRFQIVGIHPVDGTTVTTFCSASVAEDYRQQLDAIPQEMSAENVVLAQDHIPESEATVVSTDGTPVDDDLETFVEDPLVGSPSEGTLTSAKVMAAEGESEEKNCGCGQDPCKTYGAEGIDDPDFAEGHLGLTSNGDYAWGTGDQKIGLDIKLDPHQNYIISLLEDGGQIMTDSEAQDIFTSIVEKGRKPKEVIDAWIADMNDDEWRKDIETGEYPRDYGGIRGATKPEYEAETVAGIDVQTPSQIAIETPDSDELIVPDPDHLVSGDGHVIGQQTGKVNTTPMHAEGDDVKLPVMVTLPAWDWLWCEGTPTWVNAIGSGKSVKLVKEDFMELENADDFDLTEVYFGDQYDIEELEFRIKVTDQSMLDHLIGKYGKDIKSAEMHAEGDDYEYYEAPTLSGNKRVLIPTAVIGGLALAYLAKPELLSGSFDKISEMLGKMTKKGDKTE